jgi:hypothetical protein
MRGQGGGEEGDQSLGCKGRVDRVGKQLKVSKIHTEKINDASVTALTQLTTRRDCIWSHDFKLMHAESPDSGRQLQVER